MQDKSVSSSEFCPGLARKLCRPMYISIGMNLRLNALCSEWAYQACYMKPKRAYFNEIVVPA